MMVLFSSENPSHLNTSKLEAKGILLASATFPSSTLSVHTYKQNIESSVLNDDEDVIPPLVEDWVSHITQTLKENTVDESARTFWRLCVEENDDWTFTNLCLVAVLKTIHKSPQQSEAFVKALQQQHQDHDDASLPLSASGRKQQSDDGTGKRNIWKPGKKHYEMVLHGWISFDPPSAKRAEALLEYLEENPKISCNIETYNLVLQAWAEKRNAEGAQSFFDSMTLKKGITPNLASFLLLLGAWSHSKSALAERRADLVLSQMKKYNVEVTPESIALVIACWAKSKRNGTEARIESLLAWMNRLLEDDPQDYKPHVVQDAMWNVLQAYQGVRNAHRAEEILLQFAEQYQRNQRYAPTLSMCNSVLATWSKSKSSRRGYRAENLLKLMEQSDDLPEPTMGSYIAVLSCYAGSNKPDSAQRAEDVLHRMEHSRDLQPNLVSLTCVLVAWARSEDTNAAPMKAERIFQLIQDRGMKPDRYVYAGLITAWGRSSHDDAIYKVEEYLQKIRDLQKEEDKPAYRPTVIEYTATLQAYANYAKKNIDRSRMIVERVDSLLEEMLDSEDPFMLPNASTYAAVLKAISRARRVPDRGDRADAILRLMRNQNVEISPYILGLAKMSHVREPDNKDD